MNRPRRRSCLKVAGVNDDPTDTQKVSDPDENIGSQTTMRKRVSFSQNTHVKEFLKDVSSEDSIDGRQMDMTMIDKDDEMAEDDVFMEMTAVGPNATFVVARSDREISLPIVSPNVTFNVHQRALESEKENIFSNSKPARFALASTGNEERRLYSQESAYSPQDMSLTVITSPSPPDPCNAYDMSMTINQAEASRLYLTKGSDMSLTISGGQVSRKKALRKNPSHFCDVGRSESVVEVPTVDMSMTVMCQENCPDSRDSESFNCMSMTMHQFESSENAHPSPEFEISMALPIIEMEVRKNCQVSSQNVSPVMREDKVPGCSGAPQRQITDSGSSEFQTGNQALQTTREYSSLSNWTTTRNGCLEMSYTMCNDDVFEPPIPASENEAGMSMTMTEKRFSAKRNSDANAGTSVESGEETCHPSLVSPVLIENESNYKTKCGEDFSEMSMTMHNPDSFCGNISKHPALESQGEMSMTICRTHLNSFTNPSNSNSAENPTRSTQANITLCCSIRNNEVQNERSASKKTIPAKRVEAAGVHKQREATASDILIKNGDSVVSNMGERHRLLKLPPVDRKKQIPVPENSAFGRFGLAKTPRRRLPESLLGKKIAAATAATSNQEASVSKPIKEESPNKGLTQRLKQLTTGRDFSAKEATTSHNLSLTRSSTLTAKVMDPKAKLKRGLPTNKEPQICGPEASSLTECKLSESVTTSTSEKVQTACKQSDASFSVGEVTKNKSSSRIEIPSGPNLASNTFAKSIPSQVIPSLDITNDIKPDLKRNYLESSILNVHRSPSVQAPSETVVLREQNITGEVTGELKSNISSPAAPTIPKQRRILSPKRKAITSEDNNTCEIPRLRTLELYDRMSPNLLSLGKENCSIRRDEKIERENATRSFLNLDVAAVLAESIQVPEPSIFDHTSAVVEDAETGSIMQEPATHAVMSEDQGLAEVSAAFGFLEESVAREESELEDGNQPTEFPSENVPRDLPSLTTRNLSIKPNTSHDGNGASDSNSVDGIFEVEEADEENCDGSYVTPVKNRNVLFQKDLPDDVNDTAGMFEMTTVESTPTETLVPSTTNNPRETTHSTASHRFPPSSMSFQKHVSARSSRLTHSLLDNKAGKRHMIPSFCVSSLAMSVLANPEVPPKQLLNKIKKMKTLRGVAKMNLLDDICQDVMNISDGCYAYVLEELNGSVSESYVNGMHLQRKLRKFKGTGYDSADPLSEIAIFAKTRMKLMEQKSV